MLVQLDVELEVNQGHVLASVLIDVEEAVLVPLSKQDLVGKQSVGQIETI